MRHILYILAIALLAACNSHPSLPTHFDESHEGVAIFPDYTDVCVPTNIAPLNFMTTDADIQQCVAHIDYPGGSQTYGKGPKVNIPQTEWQQMRQAALSQPDADGLGHLDITLYTCGASGQWQRHPAFSIHIAPDSIDTWLSYRLIEPSYVAYQYITLNQRNVSNFDEEVMVDNRDLIPSGQEQCLNCHSVQAHHTQRMVYHARGTNGGTHIYNHGQWSKHTDLKRQGMMSNPVYPAWHPTLPLIAFSTNRTGQFFHTQSAAKVEVIDACSSLVLYDVEHDRMYPLPADTTLLENFPTWSPDGRTLYFTMAHYKMHDTISNADLEWVDRMHRDMGFNYTDLHYSLYSRSFNPDSLTFGPRQLVLPLDSMSATLPRVSPDGRFLLYAYGPYGCFHIWHREADLQALDLTTGQTLTLDALNSPYAESYPTWSDNGRWIIMASRRDDGNYSRVYIAYFDRQHRAHKAFELPQADPEHSRLLLRSYNRPEPMLERVIMNNE